MKILSITIISETYHADVVILNTDAPNGGYPFDGFTDFTARVAKDTGRD